MNKLLSLFFENNTLQMKSFKILFLFIGIVLISCNNTPPIINSLQSVNERLREKYAPDKRVAIYDIKIDNYKGKIIVTGETDSKIGYQKLLENLNSLDIKYDNRIRVLPDSAVGNNKFAIAINSVINIRSKPKHSAELGTQGLLGMPLKILDKKGDFYRIQTPDKYISWVDKGGIKKMNKEDFENWNYRKKIIFIKNFGYVYADKNENSKIISDITLGGVLRYKSLNSKFYEVEYPDNRKGFIKKDEAIFYESWLQNLVSSKENIETTANNMLGFPYLWGGTSSKGMDCSGFTKMVYFMNGVVIPRDASQQINAGKTVDVNLDFIDLQKGDLLFFGTKASKKTKQRVVHVGIWLGNDKMEFIHSSGNVHLSSMNKNQPNYDEMNKNRYLGSKRYLGVRDKNIYNLKDKLKF